MAHPDQRTPDDHRTSNRKDAPEPNVRDELKEDLGPEAQEELEDRADTGSSVRAEDTDGTRTGEQDDRYMGRTMDDDLKEKGSHPSDPHRREGR